MKPEELQVLYDRSTPAPWGLSRYDKRKSPIDGIKATINGNVCIIMRANRSMSLEQAEADERCAVALHALAPQTLALWQVAREFAKHGHPYTGACSKDHWPDEPCDCGFETMRLALEALEATV